MKVTIVIPVTIMKIVKILIFERILELYYLNSSWILVTTVMKINVSVDIGNSEIVKILMAAMLWFVV
jgi:hypothetical protein